MKKFIKRLVAVLLVKFEDNHEADIAKAKKLADKANTALGQARLEANRAEAKFDKVIHDMQRKMIAMNDKFGSAIEQRNQTKESLKAIREAEVPTNK